MRDSNVLLLGTRDLSGNVRKRPVSSWFFSIFLVRIAGNRPGRSGEIQHKTNTFVGVFVGPETVWLAGTNNMLTHIQIASAKPSAKLYNLSDSQGLHLSFQPNGSKLWRLSYRYLGRQKTFHIKAWPVSLAEARTRRDEARKQIAAGNTFKTIAEEWVAKSEREGRAPVTLDKNRWLLCMAYPMIGNLPIAKISPQEVLAVLRKLEATGRYESARRMRSVLSRVFRYAIAYAIATARADRDVASDLRGALIAPKVQPLAAITTPKEAGALLRAIDGYTGHKITAIALRLSPHLFVRFGRSQRTR